MKIDTDTREKMALRVIVLKDGRVLIVMVSATFIRVTPIEHCNLNTCSL